jgi:hypothetical protein
MKTWAWGAVAASALAAALAACGGKGGNTGGASSSSSSHTGTGTGGSASTGTGGSPGCGATVFSDRPQCQACVQASCCNQLAACTTGTPCAALLDCLTSKMCASGDTTCITGCEDANSAGVSDAQALEACYNTNCSTLMVCQTGAICQSGLMVPNVPCGMCLGGACCTEWTACGADATCRGCATSSGTDPGCDTNNTYASAIACEKSKCMGECTQICDTGLTTNNPSCDTCLGSNCCSEFDACIMDDTCDTCLLSSSPPEGCSVDNLFQAVTMCQSTSCTTQCSSGG